MGGRPGLSEALRRLEAYERDRPGSRTVYHLERGVWEHTPGQTCPAEDAVTAPSLRELTDQLELMDQLEENPP